MQTIDNYDFTGKKAIMRVDFNVPLNENFEVTDDTRIRAAAPTIKKILEEGGSTILMSHLGRPKEGPEEKFSLKHVIPNLSDVLGTDVKFATDCIGPETLEMKKALQPMAMRAAVHSKERNAKNDMWHLPVSVAFSARRSSGLANVKHLSVVIMQLSWFFSDAKPRPNRF